MVTDKDRRRGETLCLDLHLTLRGGRGPHTGDLKELSYKPGHINFLGTLPCHHPHAPATMDSGKDPEVPNYATSADVA